MQGDFDEIDKDLGSMESSDYNVKVIASGPYHMYSTWYTGKHTFVNKLSKKVENIELIRKNIDKCL